MNYKPLLLLLLLIAAGCAQEDNTLKIGVVAPLTGPLSVYGERMQRGFDIALGEINAEGGILGKQVELVYEDNRCDSKQTITSLQQLKDMHRVVSYLGPFCGSPVWVAGTFSQEHGLLGLTPNNNYGKNGNYYYSVVGSFEVEDEVLATYVYHDLGIKKVGILFFRNIFGERHRDGFTKHFERLGGEVTVVEGFDFTTKDFRTSLLKINQEADAVFIVYSVIGDILKQKGELGLNLTVISQWGMQNPTVIPTAGKHAEGIVYTFPATTSSPSFSKKYVQQYGDLPAHISASSYDSLFLLKEVYERCGNTDADCAVNGLQTLRYEGASGHYYFDPELWGPRTEYVIKTIKDGSFVLME